MSYYTDPSKGSYVPDSDQLASGEYTYRNDYTISFSNGYMEEYYTESTYEDWGPWISGKASGTDADGVRFTISSNGTLTNGHTSGSGSNQWRYITVYAIGGGSLSNSYYVLGTDSGGGIIAYYGEGINGEYDCNYSMAEEDIYWLDDGETSANRATRKFYYAYGKFQYADMKEYSDRQDYSGSNAYVATSCYRVDRSGSTLITSVYLDSGGGDYSLGHYQNEYNSRTKLKTDGSEYLKFSIGLQTFYVCYSGGYKIYTQAPTWSSAGNIYISGENVWGRTFYGWCTKMSKGTSSSGSPNGCENTINRSSWTQMWLQFNSNGSLAYMDSGTSANDDHDGQVFNRVCRIKGLRSSSSTSTNTEGMVFAGGYLIKNGCDTL